MDEDELTPDEREDETRDGIDDEEAHRAGEFDYLRDLLGDVLSEIRGLREDAGKQQRAAVAAAIGNGARVDAAPEAADETIEVADEVEDPRARDYTIERG